MEEIKNIPAEEEERFYMTSDEDPREPIFISVIPQEEEPPAASGLPQEEKTPVPPNLPQEEPQKVSLLEKIKGLAKTVLKGKV